MFKEETSGSSPSKSNLDRTEVCNVVVLSGLSMQKCFFWNNVVFFV